MRMAKSVCSVLRGTNTLTWSRLRTEIKHFHISRVCMAETQQNKYNQWTVPFKLKDPEYDLDYILNPANHAAISENIANRKGVGNIDLVPDEKETVKRQFLKAVGEMPNTSHPQSPVGEEDAAILVDLVGHKRETSGDQPQLKTMLELGEHLGMLRTSNVSLTTGHTTYYFLDQLAMLEQALVKYTVDYLLQKGFQLVSVPDLLHPEIIESCGFKTTGDVAQVYRLDTARHPDLCLIGTSEMSLAGYFTDEVQKIKDLPIKFAAVSRCYRAETSHMEDDLGLYRVHQFTKVEMFGVTSNSSGEEGNDLLMELIDIEKTLFSQLGLHFRVLEMPTTELGAPAHRKFDIEAWMPAKQFWGEISSASNCTDYQSRRLSIKYSTDSGDLNHCTTVNGTACAVPRTLMAVCETHQNQDGSINIPSVLQKCMDGLQVIIKSDCVPKLSWIKSNKLKK
ncbi:serine--tRNA ligase, mitochondrial-like isoform X2 [Mercenaria mercenaria]|uniref:serine--tRNA ligase, mitochondrial-like isoform X2 n=1 Tax=Mercenaria mercenaria TaxID=6596 RepID=UPI00234EF896|nr:serine--tRNA ligase, mitochondrial-like isoform X2 [Mercenaria mercenaria]